MLILAPAVAAQEEVEVTQVQVGPLEEVEEAVGQEEVIETPAEEAAEEPAEEAFGKDVAEAPAEEAIEEAAEGQQLVPTGGPQIASPAVILPAAVALLLGSGILTYAVLRRRR